MLELVHRRRGRPGRGDDPPAGRRALPATAVRVHRAARRRPSCSPSTAGANVFALACRVAADGDRDGIPNVWSRRWRPGCRSCRPRCRGSPSWSATASTGCSSRRRIPGALAVRAAPAGHGPVAAATGSAQPGGGPSPSGSTATCSPEGWPGCFAVASRDSAGSDGVSAAVGRPPTTRVRSSASSTTSAATWPWPRRRGPAGSRHCGVSLDLGRRPDWVSGGLADDRSGGSSGSSSTRASTSPTPTRSPASGDYLTRLGGPGRVVLRPGAGRARHLRRLGAAAAELAVRLAAVRRRPRLRRPATRPARTCWSPGSRPTPHTWPTTSPPSATTARWSCTRCCWSRWRSRRLRRRPARRSTSWPTTCRPTSAPTASSASARTDYHLIVLRSCSARSPTPRRRPRRARRRCVDAVASGRATSRCTCQRPDGLTPGAVRR